ncbi:MAG: HAMP domain-containing sensor histidine kinase [Gemmatimonadota bacterium]
MALLAVALIPAVMLLWTGTLALREVVSSAGTAGPWEAVAESGRVLLESVADEGDPSPEVRDAAREHREALSEGVRHSQIYAFVGERLLGLLPVIAVILAVLIAGLALFAARHLSRQFARPINDLVGWTRRIARSEPLPDPGGREASGIAEVRALQEALRSMDAELREGRRREIESARLRSWTEMARRVSHELKNPLTPMRMAAVTVARSEDDPAVAEAGTVLLEEIDRLDEMAHAFAHFGRLPEGPTSEIDLGELLEELARRHAVAHVPVDIDIVPGLPRVRGHYDAVLRVFRNLLVNAVDAVEGAARGGNAARGEDTIRAEDTVRAGHEGRADDAGRAGAVPTGVEISVHPRENGVEVSIRDSGPGIPPELLESIWTPDFTTKRRGSGLGLALVRRTVESYGGSVSALNAPGGGACFTVLLPAGEGSANADEV